MHLFIALLLLAGGFISAHADTVGPYEIAPQGKIKASFLLNCTQTSYRRYKIPLRKPVADYGILIYLDGNDEARIMSPIHIHFQ